MSWVDILIHGFSGMAPALFLAALLPLLARLVVRKPWLSWWTQAAVNAVVGVLVLAAGLWFWGRDGKMLTYVGLLVAVTSSQWLLVRAWRRSS